MKTSDREEWVGRRKEGEESNREGGRTRGRREREGEGKRKERREEEPGKRKMRSKEGEDDSWSDGC